MKISQWSGDVTQSEVASDPIATVTNGILPIEILYSKNHGIVRAIDASITGTTYLARCLIRSVRDSTRDLCCSGFSTALALENVSATVMNIEHTRLNLRAGHTNK